MVDFGAIPQRRQTSGMGKYYTTSVDEELLEHELDEARLAQPVAKAIRDAIAASIRVVATPASANTKKFREAARRAFARGAAWAVRRYVDHPPATSDRLFNDSGLLADGIALGRNARGMYEISAPSERLDGDLGQQLAQEVPAVDDPLSEPGVARALEESASLLVRRAGTRRR